MPLVKGSIFRLSNGTTGIVTGVTSVDGTYCNAIFHDGTAGSCANASIEPFIIAEPGHGPIRCPVCAGLKDELDVVREDLQKARLERGMVEREYRGRAQAAEAKLEELTHERDILRVELKQWQEGERQQCTAEAKPSDAHYTATPYQPRYVIALAGAGYNRGVALSYLARAPHKGELLKDMKKALNHLRFMREEPEGYETLRYLSGALDIADAWASHYPQAVQYDVRSAIHGLLGGTSSPIGSLKDAIGRLEKDAPRAL